MLVAAFARKQYLSSSVDFEQHGPVTFPQSFPLYLHYVRFKREKKPVEFRFVDYLSVLSAVQRLQPNVIMVHGDEEPTGKYWNLSKENHRVQFRKIQSVKQTGWLDNAPRDIHVLEHRADIAKLDALLQYGGVAADFDVYFLRGQRLRQLIRAGRFITCYGNKEGYNMGLLAGPATSKILWAWRRSYTDIYTPDWNFNSGFVPKFLSYLYPQEAYVLNNTCNNPHPFRLYPFFHEPDAIRWENSMAIHAYNRFSYDPIESPEDLVNGNLTSYREILLTIWENRTLPPVDAGYNDEIQLVRDFEP
ncbi:uncharacterized protein LOC129601410 [Paramacrobiotus metropolitanus]|uniref:uncharacterized protein LOC129601410 n=1 Tax=Paramacrobiotus metropolitanus TaxID=2943436 RepID=UPI002445B7A2|nr:uncharacterized protein LOC129601410 [Paramacrobiotus metropolitanus]